MRPKKQLSPMPLGFLTFKSAVAWLVCFIAATLSHAQQPTWQESEKKERSVRELREGQLKIETIQRLSKDSLRHLDRLPLALPLIVDRLGDPDEEVRFTAVKAVHAAARKIDQVNYWNRTAPDWSALEPHFIEAHERLHALKTFSRTEQLVSLLLQRKQRKTGGSGSQQETAPVEYPLGREATELLDELCRLQEDQIVEMWKLTKAEFGKLDRPTQTALFEELLSIANPRYFEFALLLTDDFDDQLIQASLNSQIANHSSASPSSENGMEEEPQEPNRRQLAEYLILQNARPQSVEIQHKLADLLLQTPASPASQASVLTCLENCDRLDSDLANAIVAELVASPGKAHRSDFYRFVSKHKSSISPELMNSVLEQGLATIRDASNDTWARSEAMHSLSDLAPGHSGVLECAKEILEGASDADEELLRETLLSLPLHGSACNSVTKQLLVLAKTNDEVISQCAMESLENVPNIESSSIEQLVERLKSTRESPGLKRSIAKVLRSNHEVSSVILRQHLEEELKSREQDRAVVDLLQAVEVVGPSGTPLTTLCQDIARNRSLPLVERLAAIHTSPSCAENKPVTIDFLQSLLHEPKEYIEIKAAALEALPSLAGARSIATLAEFTQHEDALLSCAARYGYHLAGESNTSVHLLMQMLPQTSISSTAEALLQEIGSHGESAFYEILESNTTSLDEKQVAYRILTGAPTPDWKRLLVHLKHDSEGDDFEESLRAAWDFDLSIIPPLFAQIEEAPADSAVATRAWSLADDFTSGLGADADDLSSQSALRRAIAYSASSASTRNLLTEIDVHPPAGGSPLPTLMEPPTAEAPSAEAPDGPPLAIAPALPWVNVPKAADAVPVQAPIENAQGVELDPGVLRSVEVFYGTNRQANHTTSFGSKLRWGAFGVALLSITVCLFGFIYQRLMAYSLAALVGLVGLTALANDSLDYSYWFPDLARTYNGNYSEEIKFGVCEVTIPKTHVVGQLESPSLFMKLEVRSDPSKHIVLKQTQVLTEKEFFEKLHTTLDEQGKNLLVFIHGYNVSFNDAARRTAQMAVDLKFQGAPVFYSWPSYNDWYRYPDDAENIQRSVGQIRQFLEKLAYDSGATSIHLVAHSMGNVGLTQALAGLESTVPLFNQVVLAAPDIDAKTFENEIAPKLASKAKRVTLYTSQTDLALLASRYFNSGVRVGDSSYGVRVFPGIETIDATSIDSSLLGHSYYGSSQNVLEDIANLFSDRPIADRTYLHMIENVSPPYWSFSRAPRMAETSQLPTLQ